MQKGFTAIETLIVVAILALISSGIFLSFRTATTRDTLEKSSQNALSVFSKARFDAINGKDGVPYGVRIASSTLTIFSGTSYSAGSAGNSVTDLGAVTIDQVSLSGGGYDVPFSLLTGTTSKTGTFRMTSAASTTKTFTIYKTGVVEVQ